MVKDGVKEGDKKYGIFKKKERLFLIQPLLFKTI